jgi:hypothetical protein
MGFMSRLLGRAPAAPASTSLPFHHDDLPDNVFSSVAILDKASVRYRKHEAMCETTPGIQEFVGFADSNNEACGNATASFFFWFTEARIGLAPGFLWRYGLYFRYLFRWTGNLRLTGDPSIETGPCKVTNGLNTTLNPYSWSEISNILFLSQPLGVGFSYQSQKGNGSTISVTDTSEKAAVAAWDVLQAFMQALPILDSVVKTQTVHLWTERYVVVNKRM